MDNTSPILRRASVALYALAACIVTWQRGRVGHWHTTLLIFRQSFHHLVAGTNLYAAYPAEQGTAAASLFKYSPTAALLFGPFALPSYAAALFAWSVLSAGLLYYGVVRLLPGRRGTIVALMILPELFASMQATSSNAVVAALIVLAFVSLERGQQWRGAVEIMIGTALKLFPIAAVTFAVFHPRRRRFVLILGVVAVVLVALPLVATSPGRLAQQYQWWHAIESSDARDLAFGDSVMRLVRGWIGGGWPNWPVQAAGALVLIAPVLGRRDAWPDVEFRLRYLASLLVFALLFNHQAERPSHIIGTTGAAIWFVASTRPIAQPWGRWVLVLLTLVGLRTPPLAVLWIIMQLELFGMHIPFVSSGHQSVPNGGGFAERRAPATDV